MTATPLRTRMILEFVGTGGERDGSYTNSNLKHTAADAAIDTTARAMNRLQRKNLSKLFVDKETELAD